MDIKQVMGYAQSIQSTMENLGKNAASVEAEGVAGAGKMVVKTVVNALHQIQSIDISDDLLKSSDSNKETIEDLIISSVNKAQENVNRVMEEKKAAAIGELNLPEEVLKRMGM